MGPGKKLERALRIGERQASGMLRESFSRWKHLNDFADLLDENDKLREFMSIL